MNPDQNFGVRYLLENLAPPLRVKEIAGGFIPQREET